MEIELKYGLCNRLQTIIGFYTYKNGGNLSIVWKEDDECPGTFEDCFEPISNLTFLDSRTSKCRGSFYRFPHEDYLLIYSNYKKNYIRNHKIIKPKRDTQRYIKTLNLNNCIGLHIRRTDFLPHVKNYHSDIIKKIDNEYFYDLINNIVTKNPGQKIYLATDNYETQNMFFNFFPKNIIYRKKISPDCNQKRHTSIRDAVVDLFCLIECKEFYGTEESSFSKFVENYRKNKI